MGELTRETVILAERERVFDYAADPYNAPSYISSFSAVTSGPKTAPAVGQSWQVQATFLGRPAQLTLRLVHLERPALVGFVLLGDPRAALTVRLHTGRDPWQTVVSLTLAVPSVPTFLLNGLMGGLLTGDMARLKKLMEK